ncbi:uncharacterized protein LOC113173572 isoform X1 [Anabas testudineus]|uniref:uncharacterized protein LOC113173572 isoform X1 n=1 Tax=Anabas testudineus TaxID=64144 RepID=UPI000E462120|nr:uncharacterized protein LOC113173572 isoform X1 [Anabas testudineus]
MDHVARDHSMGMGMGTGMDRVMDRVMDNAMERVTDTSISTSTSTSTSMVTSMVIVTRKGRTVMGPPAAPAAVTLTRWTRLRKKLLPSGNLHPPI